MTYFKDIFQGILKDILKLSHASRDFRHFAHWIIIAKIAK